MPEFVNLRIRRQAAPAAKPYWEEFRVRYRPHLNVIICLMDINSFIGAAPVAQVHYFNLHPSGAMQRDERLQGVMGEGGVMNCSNAQNCVEACPKGIPLTEAIAAVKRDATWHGLLGWLKE